MFKVREPVQSSYSYLKTTTKKNSVVISVTCFMFDVRQQDSVLFWVTGQEWITNRSVFCESLEFSKHSRWPNTAMKNGNCRCFLSVCVIRSENRGQSGSTESVKSKSNNLFWSMNSCSVLDVNVNTDSLDKICFRSDFADQTALRVGILTLNFPKGLWLLDLLLCVSALRLRPELTRTVWPVTADRGVWLAFISFSILNEKDMMQVGGNVLVYS